MHHEEPSADEREHPGTMEEAHRDFVRAGLVLVEVWDEGKVQRYPPYLPSFDEFLSDFMDLFDGSQDPRAPDAVPSRLSRLLPQLADVYREAMRSGGRDFFTVGTEQVPREDALMAVEAGIDCFLRALAAFAGQPENVMNHNDLLEVYGKSEKEGQG